MQRDARPSSHSPDWPPIVTGELRGLTADQVAERVREGKVNTLPERSGRTTWQIGRAHV